MEKYAFALLSLINDEPDIDKIYLHVKIHMKQNINCWLILYIKQRKLLKNIYEYNEFNKGIIQKWILYLWILKKINLKRSDKYVVLSNLSIYYA